MRIKIIILLFLLSLSIAAYAAPNSYGLRFIGISGDLQQNIVERTKVYQQDAPPLQTPEDVKNLNEQTLIEIKDGLAAYGYFKPAIQS